MLLIRTSHNVTGIRITLLHHVTRDCTLYIVHDCISMLVYILADLVVLYYLQLCLIIIPFRPGLRHIYAW